jgi:nicotinamide-nucleotide amidase
MGSSLLTQRVAEALLDRQWMLATAESCTGGGIAAACTDLAGSSQWFDRGFVTYSNQAKQDMLGVRAETLAAHGAVSEATVAEMVSGALRNSRAQVALAVSGIAGPSGGSADKPVGTVCLGWAVDGQAPQVITEHFAGDRAAVRARTVERALQGLLDVLAASP